MKFYVSCKKIALTILSASLYFLCFGLIAQATAFESLSSRTANLKCQSTCHQAENLVQAHLEKETKSACRNCHVGQPPARARSPFQSLEKFKRTSFSTTVLRSSIQMAATEQKNPPAKSSEKKGASPTALLPTGMTAIPAGEFIMGSNERWDDESPEHIAATGAFYIDLNEVTNEKYKVFTDATKRETPYHWPDGNLPKGKEQHPVVYVSWFDAKAYCEWDGGKRLPNEQEWEKASRGKDGFTYPWGHEWSLDKSNNPYKNSTGTESIGSYPDGKSPYGLYDMSGNVWEWVDSYYLPHPGNTVHRAEYGEDKRILKGGSWFDCLSYGCGLSAPTFNRSFFTPEVRNNSFGFRCAKTP
jgi:formylglycine-generating enzyme required for sulfatase activity